MSKHSLIVPESHKVGWKNLGHYVARPWIDCEFCADGDGIVNVEQRGDFYHLVDQGTHIKKLGADLSQALKVAEHYLHTNYRQIYDDHRL
jgi:hypothetical protein